MTTLFELTLEVARNLGIVEESTATGGSATTVVDTSRDEPDDFWNKGTVWITDTTDDGAPKGEFSQVSDYDLTTGTITLKDALTAAPQSGDRYAVGKRRYPIDILIQKVNQALKDLGKVVLTDTTSITTAAGQSEYSLPTAASLDLREVWLQGKTGDSDDNLWEPVYDWYIQRTAPGSADLLVLPNLHRKGVAVKLVYMDYHPELQVATDVLSEAVDAQVVVYMATIAALMFRRQKLGTADRTIETQIAYFQNLLEGQEGLLREYRPPRPPIQPRLLVFEKGARHYPGDQNPR